MRLSAFMVSIALAGAAMAQPPPAPLPAADRGALLRALHLTADARGRVTNDCGEKVTPRILPANVGGAVGVAQLVIVPNGAEQATCYGDNPGAMTLMKREGASWRAIFSGGGYIAIMTAQHGGVHDIALGGPGFSFPVYQWDGTKYAATRRNISDSEFGRYPSLP